MKLWSSLGFLKDRRKAFFLNSPEWPFICLACEDVGSEVHQVPIEPRGVIWYRCVEIIRDSYTFLFLRSLGFDNFYSAPSAWIRKIPKIWRRKNLLFLTNHLNRWFLAHVHICIAQCLRETDAGCSTRVDCSENWAHMDPQLAHRCTIFLCYLAPHCNMGPHVFHSTLIPGGPTLQLIFKLFCSNVKFNSISRGKYCDFSHWLKVQPTNMQNIKQRCYKCQLYASF